MRLACVVMSADFYFESCLTEQLGCLTYYDYSVFVCLSKFASLFPPQHLASTASCTSGAYILQRHSAGSPTMTWAFNLPLIPNWRTTWPMWCLNSKVASAECFSIPWMIHILAFCSLFPRMTFTKVCNLTMGEVNSVRRASCCRFTFKETIVCGNITYQGFPCHNKVVNATERLFSDLMIVDGLL